MNNDHSPIRFEPRTTSGTTGRAIPERPEYGAPIPVSALLQDRHTRGRKLTREEYDAEIDDHRAAIDRGQASLMAEIAGQLREEVRELEVLHSGTFVERLEAIAGETDESDDWTTGFANLLVKMALHVMKAP